MQTITAGEELTASVLNNWTPVAQASTCTAAASFSIANFTCYKIAGVTWFSVSLTYSGTTITASSSGNITDTQCCTLPFGPQAEAWFAFEVANSADGVVQVSTGGVCSLITLSPTATIVSGNIVGFSGIILTG